jgi:hypothetical protein
MCFKPSMIHCTLSLSNIPFFSIILNGAKHIQQKQIMLYNTFIFVKTQPCLCLYQNVCLLFEEVFQIM